MANNYRVFLYQPEAVSVTADNAAAYFLGELLVDNLDVSIKLQDISTVTFSMPRIINGQDNTRIDEVLDGYVIEIWYGDLDGTVDVDYYRYRFTIYSTPVNFSDNKFLHNYTGYSLEALTELKMLVSWPGIEISDFYRKISYNNTEATPKFLEPKDTGTGGNFEYTITTSGSGADYITVTPTTAVATDIDIFIYEVRQRLSGGSVVSESEAGLIPYSGTGPDDAEFKNGYYFLTISGGYVTQIDIALPDNYVDFNGESVNSQLLFFKLYDNPLSRRYAIGITTNAEQANDMYIDLAHDVAEGNPTDYEDFNFQTQTFYSKNGLTLKQVLLGKENTSTTTITEDGLLYKTGFALGTVHSSLLNVYRSNLEFNNVTRYAAIKTLAESFDAIAIYDTVNNTVSFYPENAYGVNNGLIIRYGAYLKSLNKEIDASKIITNAIGLGKDNLTINLVNPTGESYWEDYSYYLDDYYISSAAQIGAISEDANLGITFNYVSTAGYSSRWMSTSLAEKVAKWQYTRDWFHSILTGDYNPTGFSSTITQFYNFYANRLEAIRLLIKQETEYFTALKKEVKYEAFRNYYEKLYRDNPSNTTYEDKYNYYEAEFVAAKAANEALYSDLQDARDNIFDVDTAGSYAAKMVVLQGFLQKDSVARNISLTSLQPFQRETVVTDNSIDEEKDLLDIVKTHVEENKEPKVTISIDVADILAATEAQDDWNKVKIGDKINIYLPELNVDVVAQIREINVNFEDNSLSFVISTVRNYNKGFGNFITKTIRNLYNSNNNNVNYEIDGNRYASSTAENVNEVLDNGIDSNDTPLQSGLRDDSGKSSTNTSGAGTTSAVIDEIDPLTETVTSYVSTDTEGVIIAGGKVLSYHNFTSPSTFRTEVELSAETGFTIRKIEDGEVNKQAYINIDGEGVVGPVYIAAKDSTAVTLNESSGLTLNDNNLTGSTTQLDANNEYVEYKFNSDGTKILSIKAVSFNITHSGIGTASVTVTLYKEGNLIATFVGQSASAETIADSVGSAEAVYNADRVRLTLGIVGGTATVLRSSININTLNKSITLNNFNVTTTGEVYTPKIGIGNFGLTNLSRDSIIIEPSAVGSDYRYVKLMTPSTALTADRIIRFPDKSGTIALTSDLNDTNTYVTSGSFSDDNNELVLTLTRNDAVDIDINLDDVVKYGFIYGKAQSAITKGQVVQFATVQGDHILVKPAVPSEINTNPDYVVGVARDSLNTNDFGYFITFGELVGTVAAPLDTATNFNEGDILWFASAGSTPGALTSTEPTGTNAKIQVGAVTKENATEGIILVRVTRVGTDVADIKASGTLSSSTFLRGDGQWAVPAGVDNYVNITGDTMTGDLTLDKDGATTGPSHGVVFTTNNGIGDETRELNVSQTGILQFNGTAISLSGHTHDDRYYTETEVDSLLSAKQDSSTALTTSTSFEGDVSGTYNTIEVGDDTHNHTLATVRVPNFYRLIYSTTTTMTDPGTANFRLNNATASSATQMVIDDLDYNSRPIDIFVPEFTSGIIVIYGVDGANDWDYDEIAKFYVNSVTDNSGYTTLNISHIDSSADALDNGDICLVQFIELPKSTSKIAGGIKSRLDGTTLYLRNDGSDA